MQKRLGSCKRFCKNYWLIMQKRADDFVIGTGKTYSVKDFAKIALSVGLDYKKYIKIDKKLFRPAEVDLLKADYSKAKKS